MNKLYINIILGIFLTFVASLYVVPWSYFGISFPYFDTEYRLGLDLQGGVELDYTVDLDEVRQNPDNNMQAEKSIIEGLKSIIDRRVEVLKINDSSISSASYGSEEHIIVQIPLKGNNQLENQENIKRAKDAIGRVVRIEFKEKRDSISQDDIAQRQQLAEIALKEFQTSNYDFSVVASKYRDSYENVDYGTLSGSLESLKEYFDIQKITKSSGIIPQILEGNGKGVTAIEDGQLIEKFDEKGYWIINVKSIENEQYTIEYLFFTQSPSAWMSAKDTQGRVLNDQYFVKSSVQYNQAFQPMVELTFNDEGAKIFGELTQRLTGKQIAIFVGGQLLTAPRVNEPILTGKAVITGTYTPEEAKKLSQDINTGVVPAPIYLTSERTIDSRLGLDSLQKLIYSGVVGFAIIVIFLVIVYRVTGVIASFALLLYVVLVLAIVKMFGVVLTLASIAGLILSIGMAIDTNILISERIKDEFKEGESIKNALKNGFSGAFSAIWDTHLTGMLVALVLYVFGINMIKGFGLMLGIGTIVSIFVFYNISRAFIFVAGTSIKSHNIFIGYRKKHQGK